MDVGIRLRIDMLSKKKLKKIKFISVFDDILRERLQNKTRDGYFADCPPDDWRDDEKEIWDIANEIEDQYRSKILQILTASVDT